MKKVLVTGANGFVGYYLIRQLLEKNNFVIATGIGAKRLPFRSHLLAYEEMDIVDKKAVSKVFEKHSPIVVVHSAAISKPDECESNRDLAYTINVEGTINLLKAAALQKAFFIFLSTDFVFDGENGMYSEEDSLKAVNYYGETKIIAERNVKAYTYLWSIVRTVLVYGASFSGRENIVTSVAKALQKGDRLSIYDDQVRTPTYVEDLAKGIIAIIEKEATGIYHISGKDFRTPYQIAVEVAEYLGLDKTLISKVTRENFVQPALRPLKTGFDITKVRKDLGYEPISFEEGLKKTFALPS
ncbi:MAG: NAD(P)-dependent oxidoreductase [Chitinophagaceae bacterium]